MANVPLAQMAALAAQEMPRCIHGSHVCIIEDSSMLAGLACAGRAAWG